MTDYTFLSPFERPDEPLDWDVGLLALSQEVHGSDGSVGTGARGNTVPAPVPKPPKFSRGSYAKHWMFTLNNWTSDEWTQWNQLFNNLGIVDQYVCGKETGDQGTPHLQGYIKFQRRQRLVSIQRLFGVRAHWEVAKRPDIAIDYCSKDGDFVSNIPIKKPISVQEPTRDWQRRLREKLERDPDHRTIFWYWDAIGNVGKTSFSKWAAVRLGAVVLGGKKGDIFHAIAKLVEKDQAPNVVIFDVPRQMMDFCPYAALEKVKDGLFYSGKYEGTMCVFNSPHVVVFANQPPDRAKLSADRWVIKEIVSNVF